MKTISCILTAFLCLQCLAAAGPKLIHAGPMVGHVSDTTASVWIRIKHGTRVTGVAVQGNRFHKPTHWHDRGADCHVIGFSGLQAATKTAITLTSTRDGSDPEEVTMDFNTYPAPSQTGDVRLAFGSCSKISQYPSGPIYNAIAKEDPQMMIFLGDNAYFIVADGSDKHFSTSGPVGDWNFPDSMRARHLLTRVHPDLQTMLRRVPSYGIWDDHDYGPDNSDRTFELKEEALRIFKQMWANPGWGTPETPGIFSSFRCGPAEVFLMDDRYYKYSPQKHKDVTKETGAIWGEAQLAWLCESLKKSTAPVKVIANGTQVLCQDGRGEGHYQEARREFQFLADTLAEHKIGGVVFLSGDRHHSEAMQQAQPDGTLLVDLTSSPLQQDQPVSILDRYHRNQIWGMRGNNFGLLTISIPEPGNGTVTFETRDASNQTNIAGGSPCKTTWTLPQLNYGIEDRGEIPQTWTPLFNCTDLSGWTQRNGTATYRVEETSIVGRTTEGNGRVHGPQIEIEAAPGEAGYIYSEGTDRGWLSQTHPKTDPFKNGEWNHFFIRAEGDRIRTWINSIEIADLTDAESSSSGFIGLQVHGISKGTGPFEVRWRNLFVKPLANQ
ncbi:MAG: alkaline phosphatase D family protein [Verrucomicrobiales bacterium]